MQAMSCGLPVIGADERALKEYIQPAHGRKVARGDWENLAQEIVSIFKDPELAQKLGRNGLELVRTLSAPKIAERWEKIYETAAREYAVRRQ
jgi:glycosyltransferase involved in cell wall biosynthesis